MMFRGVVRPERTEAMEPSEIGLDIEKLLRRWR